MKEKTWYGAYNKEKKEREKSTSGAIFPAIAEYFLKNNGLVVGCIWNEDMKPVHVIAENKEELQKMRGSKYVQSDLKDVVKKIKDELPNKKILFSGTPCQIAAIKSFIGNNQNLYTCALICEGVPSNKVWQKYKKTLEKKYKSKMTYASFRNKEISWESPIAFYKFENNKETKNMSFNADKYVVGFLEGLYYRNSCSNCQYKGNGHNADIIIGDLWGATKEQKEKSDEKGISLIITNSNKGEEILEKIKGKIVYEVTDMKSAIEHNKLLMFPIKKHKNRDKFFRDFKKNAIEKNIKNNLNRKLYKGNIKNFLYKIKVFEILKKWSKS